MEKTLLLLKPDAVVRGVCGEIIARFEQRGLKPIGIKMLQLSKEQAEIHYAEHQGKVFFEELVQFITSGPLIAMVVCGENAIKLTRMMMGATNPLDAPAGTIRGDYATTMRRNIIHGSDGPTSAAREIKIFFEDHELFGN
ncbi:nucleoside-diphosphate kinase [Pelosinus sp. sgz500959]|uniref:nucleoside-diphosphate kinase n=1 Tax=Pelosinus sp. sgz500959 TaxID=3242472 RepID=UPI00367189A5